MDTENTPAHGDVLIITSSQNAIRSAPLHANRARGFPFVAPSHLQQLQLSRETRTVRSIPPPENKNLPLLQWV